MVILAISLEHFDSHMITSIKLPRHPPGNGKMVMF